MVTSISLEPRIKCPLAFDFGTFHGFNFRDQSVISKFLTAKDVVNWDHDGGGEAEFWPSGNHSGVSLIFRNKTAVTSSEICALDRLLSEFESDSPETFLQIHHAVNVLELDLFELHASDISEQNIHLFIGSSIFELRRTAAYELFELYYPEPYAVWERTNCDGLLFDTDRFLDSPSFAVDELTYEDTQVLIVSPR